MRLRKVEALAAGAITLVAAAMHLLAMTSAGGLWRDESNTIGLVTLPSLADVWKNLQYDSFPFLWLLILRGYVSIVGPMNDPALRALGFGIGISILAALWVNARVFRHSVPLVSLVLLGICPSLIVWGDSVRAYGFGILTMLLTCALIWRFVERPTLTRFTLAAIISIASVQTLYYNSVVLLALCSGAFAVTALRKQWTVSAKVIVIGMLAAISVTPYIATINGASRWNALVQLPEYTFPWFWSKLHEALSPAGFWTLTLWLEILVVTVVVAVRAVRSRGTTKLPGEAREKVIFFLVTLGVVIPAYYIFLKALSYETQPWYYLTLLGITAVCLDGLIGALVVSDRARLVRLVTAAALTMLSAVPAYSALRMRMTTMNEVARTVEQAASPGDAVIVGLWIYGVSFDRYYHGAAAWNTIPPISVHRFHRYDLVSEFMLQQDQSQPVSGIIADAARSLQRGHAVFVVANTGFDSTFETPVLLRAAREPFGPMAEGQYGKAWKSMVRSFLQKHALSITPVPISPDANVNRYERPRLFVARGWRP
jgi:hypothetical protein